MTQALINLATTAQTPTDRVLDEDEDDSVSVLSSAKAISSSRKPEAHPRVGSATASVRTTQDRHVALNAMISEKDCSNQDHWDT